MTKKTGTIILLVILLILLTIAKFKGYIGGEDALIVKTENVFRAYYRNSSCKR
ncbi:MAG: hypothetical protein CM15mP23_08310 [Cryomorphaceae bacterium]|nr:MAG: hypothetical protein CM15mP23_08310 [Cryomorphaceae bacterium]